MRNRAKCRKCSDIIESFHATDYVSCKCGAIAVSGGAAMRVAYDDIQSLLRVDDEGNEIVVKEIGTVPELSSTTPTRVELMNMLTEMIKGYEKLPPHALAGPVSNYDLVSALLLLAAILRSERD